MDTLTHALSGALAARATAPKQPGPDTLPLGRRVAVGFLTAAFPDLDVVTSYLSPLSYLYYHRGVTHSLVMLPIWAVLLAGIFALIWRGKPSWRAYVGVCAIGLMTHIVGDLITSFGTMILAPLSDTRYALSATFIIDLWFTGIILVGLVASSMWRHSRIPALGGVAMLCSYVGLQALMQQRAIGFGEAYAYAQGLAEAKVTAMPRPVSPFNWTVFVQEPNRYTYAHVNLIRKKPLPEPGPDTGFIARLDAAYRPLADAQWVRVGLYGNVPEEVALAREAYGQPDFEFFRWFAAYPALLHVETGNPSHCAWFHDLRFATPGRSGTSFSYGMCRAEGGVWRPFQLVGSERLPVY